MFIQTESTPNPASLKFLPGQTVLENATREFVSAEEAAASPLADALFAVEGVRGVFFAQDFLTITKADGVDWAHIKPALLGAIMDFYVSGAPILHGDGAAGAAAAAGDQGHASDVYHGEAAEIVTEIKELLDTRVRPAVAADGGDITFHRFEPESGRVFLTMRGACAGCPSSTATLKMGIENLLKTYVPEVTGVEAVL